MKKMRKFLLLVILLLSIGLVSCGTDDINKDDPINETETITITFNTNGGTSVSSKTINKGSKLENVTNPTKKGYVFKGWYTDTGLTTLFDFNKAVNSNTTLYAKWEKESNEKPFPNGYIIVNTDEKIATNLTFSSESHTSVNEKTLDLSSYPSDKYSVAYSSSGSNINGVSVSAYRYGKSSGKLVLYPKNSNYSETSYHGIDGSLFNSRPLGGINSLEITYETSTSNDSLINPNVRFGLDEKCMDYGVYLEPSTSSTTQTINVNLSHYKYFIFDFQVK